MIRRQMCRDALEYNQVLVGRRIHAIVFGAFENRRRAARTGRGMRDGNPGLKFCAAIFHRLFDFALLHAVAHDVVIRRMHGTKRFQGAARCEGRAEAGQVCDAADAIVRSRSAEERRRCRQRRLRKPVSQNGQPDLPHITLLFPGDRIGRCVERRRPGEIDKVVRTRLREHGERGRARTHDMIFGRRCERSCVFPTGEACFDLRFHRLGIDVADHNQHSALGPIIGRVELPQLCRRSIFHRFAFANGRQGVGKAHTQSCGEIRLAFVKGGHIVLSCLGEHDGAFRRNRGRVKRQTVPDIAREKQRLVERCVVVGGKVEFEDGSVRRGERIQIGADREPEALKRLEGFAVGKMPRAAESHVFDKMGDAFFAIRFVE